MNEADALDIMQAAIWTILVASGPAVAAGMIVGIVIALIQALTQVQEQTLSFAIKLIAVAVTIVAMSGLLGSQMLDYTLKLFNDFPEIVG